MTPPETYKSRVRRMHPVKQKDEDNGILLRWLKNAGLAIAVLSAAGALFGYGVSLGLSAAFGFGSGVWYTSTLELISLCGEGFVGAVTALTSHVELKNLLAVMTAYGVSLALLMLLTMLFGFAVLSQKQRIARWRNSLPKGFTLPKRGEKLQPSWSAAKKTAAMVAAAGAGGFLAIPLVGLILMGLFATISIVPLLGYGAGSAYAKDLILRPRYCVSSINVRTQSEKAPKTQNPEVGANCVEVTNADTKETFSGRLVIARLSYAVLYRPKQDDVVVVTIKAGSMRTVHALDGVP